MFENSRERFMAFNDGVFAVILTVLVLEIKAPLSTQLWSSSWRHFAVNIFIYIASFLLVSTYWYFHQKLFSRVKQISGTLIILNCYFLFFLSLMPLLTQLLAMNPLARLNNFIYALAYLIFNGYLWWLFHVVYRDQQQAHDWSATDIREAQRLLKVVRGTVVVGGIACLAALVWGPLVPVIVIFSPLVRDVAKAIKKFWQQYQA
ncbi:TMEM175 family protein [Levilactobacillus enshiensis]|uniref:TMEM175 family protein n=1 Tax=Levilactobacillus enshiensis TaxID=2590213 RepID=UPI00117A8D23|nr:TMEM175 family protein [Levilactobacillus enshiensis]